MNKQDHVFMKPYEYEYAMVKLSKAVYYTPDEIRRSMEDNDPNNDLLPGGWTLTDDVENTNSRTGFVAYTFINREHGQIAISYRGSEPSPPNSHGLIDYRGANVAIAQDSDFRDLPGVPDRKLTEEAKCAD